MPDEVDFLAECAVEPEVMARWEFFQTLWSYFAVDQGRLISDYPKRWLRQVQQRARQLARDGVNKPLQLQTMIEHLGRPEKCRHRMWPNTETRPWAPDKTWLENAQGQADPFDLIITLAAPNAHASTVVAENLLPADPPFHRLRQQRIPRRTESIVKVSTRLLMCSRQLRIVEPHFAIDRPDFVVTIRALMATVFGQGCCRTIDPSCIAARNSIISGKPAT